MHSQTLSLVCHPDTPSDDLSAIDVRVTATDRGIELVYLLAGDPSRLCLPGPATPGPADELWRHTCCEAFLAGPRECYRELNFSPSGQWAVYDFAAYRQRAPGSGLAADLAIRVNRQAAGVELAVDIPASLLPSGTTALGLTAVIESGAGQLSYWALAHAPDKPDFHRRETFTLRLEQP